MVDLNKHAKAFDSDMTGAASRAEVERDLSASVSASDCEIRFVTDATIFEPLKRLLAAREDRYKDAPVALTVTPSALLFNISTASVPCTLSIPLAKRCSPSEIEAIEIPSRLLSYYADKKERAYEGQITWAVDLANAAVRVLHGTTALHLSASKSPPARASFPEALNAPIKFQPSALRQALIGVQPAAATKDAHNSEFEQIGIKDGRATAAQSSLLAEYTHDALDGLSLRIRKKDVDAVASLLKLIDTAAATIQANESGVVISDQKLSFAFFPGKVPMPDTEFLSKLRATHTFECDRRMFLKALEQAGTVATGSAAKSLQIGLFLISDRGKVHLRAVTNWGNNHCEHARLPIDMAREQQNSVNRTLEELSTIERQTNQSTPAGGQAILDLGYFRHAHLLNIVSEMKAPVISCNFIAERALWITGRHSDVETYYLFYGSRQDMAHGISKRF